MDFNKIKYERVNFDEAKKVYEDTISKIDSAKSFDEVKSAIETLNKYRAKIDTMGTVSGIRYSINTNDEFFKKENEYWDEVNPLFGDLNLQFYKAVLDSDFTKEIEEHYGRQYLNLMKCGVKSICEEIIPLLQEENKLGSEYTALLSSAKIEFDNRTCNLSDMSIYMSSQDEEVRKEAIRLHTKFFEENEEKFDEIYDKLVKLRHKMATTMGYKNFIELGYNRMQRTDYDETMVARFREKIRNKYTPMAAELYKEQAKRIGADKIDYYNQNLEFMDGNASPVGDGDFIIEQGKKMYGELSPETEEFYNFLVDNNLFDVQSREGKSPGGYCTILPEYSEPFIFGNFNGTVDDIDVLTHEAGHAFQVFMSRHIQEPELIFPTLDSCEIHSMSMEFLTYPWMELFFGDSTEKYKKYHHDSSIKFLPYGILVDHFQHEVYANPDMTCDERKATWRRLEKLYLPYKDYVDLDLLERGGYWFRQGHIFKNPFYYIDYVLAQEVALQFYELMKKDYKLAWSKYLDICKVGGRYSFNDIVKIAGLENPF